MKALYLFHPGGISDTVIDLIHEIPNLDLEVDHTWESYSTEELADRIRQVDVVISSRAPKLPEELAENPGNLKYACYLHGGVAGNIGRKIVESPILVTNWGDHPGVELAEGALVLLYSCLKDVHTRIMAVREKKPRDERIRSVGGTIQGLRVGVYGYGFAGKAFVKLIQPLGANISIFDPYAKEIPEGCSRADSLEDLFENIQAIVVHAALTPETEKSISADLLAKLPDHGIVVNTARGAIIDQDALFAELKRGRLRAGLDVLSPDHLPEDHEAREWENLMYGRHCFSQFEPWPGESPLTRRDEVILNNLRLFSEGKPLEYVIDQKRFELMT